jgi:NAD(P)-dependent dehydrogenase (short-subunit alcohol dehydrogenase family)
MNELRTIIVTGASSGIGAYSARALKAEGWHVFATARKPEDIAALEADGIEAFYLDYREPDSIAKLVEDVLVRTGGRLDALFNNGAYSQPGAVEDIATDVLREQFEANFFGWHALARRVVDEYDGALPCDEGILRSFHGIGPKCANLVLGIACSQSRIGVDIHVHRVTNRWGFVQTPTPEKTMAAVLEQLPRRYWIEFHRRLALPAAANADACVDSIRSRL